MTKSKIFRSPTKATGGITEAEKSALALVSNEWIGIAMRTDPIDPEKITPAIHGIYAAARLKQPRVVVVSSPLVMAFAYGASAAIWHKSTRDATRDATEDATEDATRAATFAATDAATFAATDAATRDATRDATFAATRAATFAATRDATRDATDAATRDA
ncbi:MAG: hypothetical protein ACRC14_04825, partial [Paracoccaceae bacterium]